MGDKSYILIAIVVVAFFCWVIYELVKMIIENGYIGLLAILVAVAAIIIYVWLAD